jgi:hypothetical protein
VGEGGIRLGGAPSLWVAGRAEWVAVHWEEPGTEARTLLGYGVPESIASSITAYLQELPSMSRSAGAEWVLSLEDPSRALFGKPGPGESEVTFSWRGTEAEEPAREQMVPVSELEKWPGALALYGSPDPDEIRRSDRYDTHP